MPLLKKPNLEYLECKVVDFYFAWRTYINSQINAKGGNPMTNSENVNQQHKFKHIRCQLNQHVGEIILNRIEVHNAFDEIMINELIEALDILAENTQCGLLVLKANGKHFSGGADLNWMRKQANMDFEHNVNDAKQLALLMQKLDNFPKPTIVLINGAAFGGALGLICCCDIAIADQNAKFCLSEVSLGLMPAVISPYVLRAMGQRMARRYMLTAEVFKSETALKLNIIHQISEKPEFAAEQFIATLAKNSPKAMGLTKKLIKAQENGVIDQAVLQFTAEQIAKIRVSKEGQEGLSAFFDKRKPDWVIASSSLSTMSNNNEQK